MYICVLVCLCVCWQLTACGDSGDHAPPSLERYEQAFETEGIVRGEEFRIAFLSTDWRFIVFKKEPLWEDSTPLYAYDTQTGKREKLGAHTGAQWIWQSADGEHLYYLQGAEDESRTLRVWPSEGDEDRVIAEELRWATYLEQYDIFYGEREQVTRRQAYSWEPSTGRETLLARESGMRVHGPHGRYRLFASEEDYADGPYEVRLWDAKTNEVTTITSDTDSTYPDFGFVGTDDEPTHVYYVQSMNSRYSREGDELHVQRISDGRDVLLDRDVAMQAIEDIVGTKDDDPEPMLERIFWTSMAEDDDELALRSWGTETETVHTLTETARSYPVLRINEERRLAMFYRQASQRTNDGVLLSIYDFETEREHQVEALVDYDSARFLEGLPAIHYRLQDRSAGEQYRVWNLEAERSFTLWAPEQYGFRTLGTVAKDQTALVSAAALPGEDHTAVFELDFDDYTMDRLTPQYWTISGCSALVGQDGRRFIYAGRHSEEAPLQLWLGDRAESEPTSLSPSGRWHRCGNTEASESFERGYAWGGRGRPFAQHLYPLAAWRGLEAVDPADGALVASLYRPRDWQLLIFSSGLEKESKLGDLSRYSFELDRTSVLAESIRLTSLQASDDVQTLSYLAHADERYCRRSCSNSYCTSDGPCASPAYVLDRPAGDRVAREFELGPYAERILAVGDGKVLWVSAATPEGTYGRETRQLMFSRRVD